MEYYYHWENGAPACLCDGQFTVWANVKCPNCTREIPYNNGVKDPFVRANDRIVIVLRGATVIGDDAESSWRCCCVHRV